MAALAEQSGVPRETIHFYLREGLLPKPQKEGQTVAYYGEEHLARLRLIRHLRENKYLPIAVIRRLLESPADARDLDVLADVLHIIPAHEEAQAPSAEARAVAIERGLIGPTRSVGAAEGDPAERRVLRVIDEALALDEDARRMTLNDLQACAAALTELVGREAALFFDAMFQGHDVSGTIRSLQRGRPAVARFIAAYRDLELRRIVEEVLVGLEQGPQAVLRTATVPLSPRLEEALGVPARRASLWDAVRSHDEGSAVALVWHLFQTGAVTELAALPAEMVTRLPARLRPLAAWGAMAVARNQAMLDAFAQAVEAAPDLALGQLLLGEAAVAQGLRRGLGGAGLLEMGVPALNRVFCADPARDPETVARAFGWFHRGRLSLALPAVLGRRDDGLRSLHRALALVNEDDPAFEPAARVRIAANANLSLARHYTAIGEPTRATERLEAAVALDPGGPIELAARWVSS